MKQFILAIVCATSLASAADFGGRWFGTLTYDGDTIRRAIGFELRQVQDRIMGVVVGKIPLLFIDGPVTGDSTSFRVEADREELVFETTLEGDRLIGRVVIRKDGKDTDRATLEAFRAIDAPSTFAGTWTGELNPARDGAKIAESVTIRIFPHSAGTGGFITWPGRSEEILPMGEIRDGKLKIELEDKRGRFELAASGDGLEGSFRNSTLRATRQPVRNASASGVLGHWAGFVAPDGRSAAFPFHLERNGDAFTGGVSAAPRRAFSEVAVAGNRVTFRLTVDNEVLRFDLTVDGDMLSGTMVRNENGVSTTYQIRAVRRL
jgi:hypothetical protein